MPEQRSILDALQQNGPMTRQALAAATGQPIGPLGTRLALLAARGLVQVGAELVALPGQRADDWLPDVEAEHERRREAWQRQGIVILSLSEALDPFLAERLHCWACPPLRAPRAGAGALSCATQAEIAAAVGLPRVTVTDKIAEFVENEQMSDSDIFRDFLQAEIAKAVGMDRTVVTDKIAEFVGNAQMTNSHIFRDFLHDGETSGRRQPLANLA